MSGPLPWQVGAGLAVLAAALAISAITDLRSRLILDVVTAPALAAQLLLRAHLGGRPMLLDGIYGVAICWLPLFLASLPKEPKMGEGDAKLMAVAGAAAGAPFALVVLFWVSIAGGVQALLSLAWARLRQRPAPRTVPYGLAIAAGCAVAWVYGAP